MVNVVLASFSLQVVLTYSAAQETSSSFGSFGASMSQTGRKPIFVSARTESSPPPSRTLDIDTDFETDSESELPYNSSEPSKRGFESVSFPPLTIAPPQSPKLT